MGPTISTRTCAEFSKNKNIFIINKKRNVSWLEMSMETSGKVGLKGSSSRPGHHPGGANP